MDNRILNIDEIKSIQNKHFQELDRIYKQEHPDEDIPMEPEPSDEESDISIVLIENKKYYRDLDNNLYEIKKDNQIGDLIKK